MRFSHDFARTENNPKIIRIFHQKGSYFAHQKITHSHMVKTRKKAKTDERSLRWNDNQEDTTLINLFTAGIALISKKDDTKWIKKEIGDKYFKNIESRTVYHHYRKIAFQLINEEDLSGFRKEGNIDFYFICF